MERHNQEADQMQLLDSLASLVVEDAEPFGSSCSQVRQATGVIPAQHTPSLEPRIAVAMPSRTQPQTGMSSSLPSQSGLGGRLPEVGRASPVHQRPVDDSLSLQQNLLKWVDPKAVKAITGSSPPSFSLSRPPTSGSFSDLSSLKKSESLTDISDEDIEHYRDQFPGHLKSDILDAMILYQEDDLDDVLQFLSRVDSDVRLKNREKPKVKLYTDVRPDINTPVGQLDNILPLCMYTFLYVTKRFCADGWTEFSSQTCLMHSINNPEKKWSVVPIFTESRRHATYNIPASICSLKGIQYWSADKFCADSLRKLLEDKLEGRRSKEAELKHERKKWIIREKIKEIHEAKRREQEIQHILAEESKSFSVPKEPSRNGFPDLLGTHSSTGRRSSRYPPPSPDDGGGMEVKPMAVTKPFNPAAEEQQWKKLHYSEQQTAVWRLSDCGEESREQLSDDDENHSSNAETMDSMITMVKQN